MIRRPRTGVEASYLGCSKCDGIKHDGLSIAGEATEDRIWNCGLFIAPRRR